MTGPLDICFVGCFFATDYDHFVGIIYSTHINLYIQVSSITRTPLDLSLCYRNA